MRLSLKKSRFEINMQKIQSILGKLLPFDNLFEIQVLWNQSNQSVSIFCLSWKPLNTHLDFCSAEVALLVRLNGEHSSPCHIISRLDFPHVDEIKNLVVNPGSVLKMFCSANCLYCPCTS